MANSLLVAVDWSFATFQIPGRFGRGCFYSADNWDSLAEWRWQAASG